MPLEKMKQLHAVDHFKAYIAVAFMLFCLLYFDVTISLIFKYASVFTHIYSEITRLQSNHLQVEIVLWKDKDKK